MVVLLHLSCMFLRCLTAARLMSCIVSKGVATAVRQDYYYY